MQRIPESELIINARGAIYHLNLKNEELADTIITVGDPDRVKEVSKHFDKLEFQLQHREFVTHTGFVGKKRLSVISSGIGPDNIDIVLNEIDAVSNIDLADRTIKSPLRTLNIIRVGTSGSLQKDIPVDSFVTSTHGLGMDNLLHFYRYDNNEEEKQLIHAFVTQTQLHNRFSYPYLVGASPSLLKHFTRDFHQGITVTCPGFYGPQGRVLRLGLSQPDLVERLTEFSYGHHKVCNFEMETAAIYGLGRKLGHHCLSLSVIVANRVTREFSRDSHAAVEKLIQTVLETVSEF